jgi:uncharacterized protein YoxC
MTHYFTALDKLQTWSFDGIEFPCERWSIKGGLRDHVHEYWKTNGGDPELGGRKLYEFHVTGNFQDRFRQYVGLFPDRLDKLLRTFEIGKIAKLLVPFRGTFNAYAFDWDENADARARSGEKVTIAFREARDQDLNVIGYTDPSSLQLNIGASALQAKLAQLVVPPNDRSLFDSINDLVNAVLAINDSSALYGQLVAAKIDQLTSYVAAADRLVTMQQAEWQPVVEALHALWASAQQFARDIQGKGTTLQKWTVTATMAMSEVSIAIYGDTAHLDDLLSLNTGTVRDPMRVPAGTTLVYYPVS